MHLHCLSGVWAPRPVPVELTAVGQPVSGFLCSGYADGSIVRCADAATPALDTGVLVGVEYSPDKLRKCIHTQMEFKQADREPNRSSSCLCAASKFAAQAPHSPHQSPTSRVKR